jgi:plasmid stabilization system protein ParE
MRARFLRPAEQEVDEAIAYFDEQRDGLGERFERDLQAAVEHIVKSPRTGKRIGANVRKHPLRTFRYNVIYAIDGEEVVLIAVAHHRRRPGYWHRRLALIR